MDLLNDSESSVSESKSVEVKGDSMISLGKNNDVAPNKSDTLSITNNKNSDPGSAPALEPTSLSAQGKDQGGEKNGELSSSQRSRGSTSKGGDGTLAVIHEVYGRETRVDCAGAFPNVGSQLGPYFFFQTIGKGTFSSIHKCVNLKYFHHTKQDNGDSSNNDDRKTRQPRVAVAKIELADFVQSGVLEAEAMILDYLSQNLPEGSVPKYMGLYRSVIKDRANINKVYAAIVMEYLPGPDMHVLREKVMAGANSRRLTVPDAVFLTANVMLPLLKQMHQGGIVHRDVKPSNCVRSSPSDKGFCLVDFGLSKSVVEPAESPAADKEHPWPVDQPWLKPINYQGKGYYRKPRERADFRGTSMYASLRVHQEYDYCARDDVWSLLYVFCDLVSGGLPWMSHAASRDRDGCQAIKERVHGLGDLSESDETELLLMGDEYHVVKFRHEKQNTGVDSRNLPEPSPMSKDEKKIDYLRKAFAHLATLEFWDVPDYDLVQNCILGFLEDPSTHQEAKEIVWDGVSAGAPSSRPKSEMDSSLHLVQRIDPVDTEMFQETKDSPEEPVNLDTKDWTANLPIDLRFHLAQLKFHATQYSSRANIPSVVALRDWMKVAQHLLDRDWNARQCEGQNRTSSDGLRRETYLRCVQRCLKAAEVFDFFQDQAFYTESTSKLLGKRKRLCAEMGTGGRRLTLVDISRAIWGMKSAAEAEMEKRLAPPASLSFAT